MFRYTPTNQLSLDDFLDNLGKKLNVNNRWVRLAHQIPWDDFAKVYAKSLSDDFGRPSKDARLVIGAMIIKQMKRLPDEEVIPEIQENPYLQYFIGLKEFTHEPVFDPSLFVTLRNRLGQADFDSLSQTFIDRVNSMEKSTSELSKTYKSDKDDANPSDKNPLTHRGQLIIDAVVAPQDIKYPTDLDLLNQARETTEQLIDFLWIPEKGQRKPRTYRKTARKDYLNTAKKKQKSQKHLRKALRKQLGYMKRNLNTINLLLKLRSGKPLPFDEKDIKRLWVVQEVYRQQQNMYDTQTNTIEDRIVSLSQPHVRPIVRGKAGKNTEFGAKLSCSLVDGFAYLDHLSWNAFNEKIDLMMQVEKYKERFGFYPEIVHADQIYGTHENRRLLKENGIKYGGKPLGRPRQMTKEEKRAFRASMGIRNRIEGKFGEGKRKYDLDCVKTKTRLTSESWIACTFFVMNLAHWLRIDFFVSVFGWMLQRLYRQVIVLNRFMTISRLQMA